ncbi:hypothetical protein MAPG_06117, partial [Magnaporthiopsis poae ATCC 64411]|uniref:Uncharacterized protein n=1 Tax=Magnaporthiopsis poae (strain ATCC 64411 / 73-15) TaxID=644358 RepID=A0A0C4E168_MAGP6
LFWPLQAVKILTSSASACRRRFWQPRRSRQVQNAAARIVSDASRLEHPTSIPYCPYRLPLSNAAASHIEQEPRPAVGPKVGSFPRGRVSVRSRLPFGQRHQNMQTPPVHGQNRQSSFYSRIPSVELSPCPQSKAGLFHSWRFTITRHLAPLQAGMGGRYPSYRLGSPHPCAQMNARVRAADSPQSTTSKKEEGRVRLTERTMCFIEGPSPN